VLVANNDLQIDEGMLGHLVGALADTATAGMAMPKIYHYYGDRTRLWCPGAYWRRFPPTVKMIADVPDGPAYNTQKPIEFAPSCCLLISRAALTRAGVFDTDYFFYFDDWDYSIRLRRAGFQILFVPEAQLWHKVSLSTQKSDKPARWWRIMGQSAVRYYLRYTNRATLLTFAAWFAMRETISGKGNRVLPFLGGVWQALRPAPMVRDA
jgi:GT2 family glycosyltransferase